MIPAKHLVWGISFCAVLFMLNIVGMFPLIIILTSTILIDVDHLFYYVVRFKKFNLFKMHRYFRGDACLEHLSNPLPVLLFHNLETMLILLIASFVFPLVVYVLIGVILHMLLDWKAMPASRYPAIIKLSLIGVLIENSRRKKGNYKW